MYSHPSNSIPLELHYGFKCHIFRNSTILPASIYLDNLYDNFLWIATKQSASIIDLSFTMITFYSLELQLELRQLQNQTQFHNKKYMLIKEFNTQIPLIFDEPRTTQFSSEQNIREFDKGRRPAVFQLFSKLINQKRQECNYSANFSRIFKKMRIALQKQATESFTKITEQKIINVLASIQELSVQFKNQLFEVGKILNPADLIEALKYFYCRMNGPLLKILSKSSTEQIRHSASRKYLDENDFEQDFMKLMELQNQKENYIIKEHQIDENLPLTDYFCFSSHNTYLSGNQLTSDSKVSRYIEDLKKGIKCVELDVHNKGDNQPIITHALKGKGFCKPISFRQTIQAIDEFLEYNKNHYPIILSIQNHASRQNQDLMNNILRKQFPKNILIPNDKPEFYRLAEIKNKIIVKTSCSLQNLIQFRNNDETPKTKNYDISHFTNNHSFLEPSSQKFTLHQPNTSYTFTGNSQSFDTNDAEIENQDYKIFLDKISKFKKLKAKFNQRIDQNSYLPVEKIVQITCLFKAPKGIQSPKPSPFECASMQNSKIQKTAKEKIVNYTKKSWLRSYPQGTQISSNNYNFLQLLARGVQIIALNTQTNDDYAIMMNSYFRAGRPRAMASIGFIEKPQYLRNNPSSLVQPVYPNQKRRYDFAFYTKLNLEFTLYSLDNAKIQEKTVSEDVKRIAFSLKNYNESFLLIKISQKKYVECLPLRFLDCPSQRVYKTIIGRDYEFQDCGIRIICSFNCKKE